MATTQASTAPRDRSAYCSTRCAARVYSSGSRLITSSSPAPSEARNAASARVPRTGGEQLADLDHHRAWDEDRPSMGLQQRAAFVVVVVAPVGDRDQRAGVGQDHLAFRRTISSRTTSARSANSGSANSVPAKDSLRRGAEESSGVVSAGNWSASSAITLSMLTPRRAASARSRASTPADSSTVTDTPQV